MFAKHLPPSAEQPRVLALDAETAAALAEAAGVERADGPADAPPGPFDAIAGHLPTGPSQLALLRDRLRPGGRLILVAQDEAQALLAALVGAGLIHCLVEPLGRMSLCRGERPHEGGSMERLRTRGGYSLTAKSRFVEASLWMMTPGTANNQGIDSAIRTSTLSMAAPASDDRL